MLSCTNTSLILIGNPITIHDHRKTCALWASGEAGEVARAARATAGPLCLLAPLAARRPRAAAVVRRSALCRTDEQQLAGCTLDRREGRGLYERRRCAQVEGERCPERTLGAGVLAQRRR